MGTCGAGHGCETATFKATDQHATVNSSDGSLAVRAEQGSFHAPVEASRLIVTSPLIDFASPPAHLILRL